VQGIQGGGDYPGKTNPANGRPTGLNEMGGIVYEENLVRQL